MRTLLAAGLFALVVPACIVGPGEITGLGGEEEEEMGEGGGSGGTTLTPRIAATVDKTTITTELGKTEILTLTVQSMDGFAGSVPITPSMIEGFAVTATPASLELTAGGTVTAQLSVKVPTNPTALTPQLTIDLGGASPASVTSDLTIANKLTLDIAAGTGTGLHTALPAANAPIRLRGGAQIVFHNSDGIQHVIHGAGGIPHENLGAGMPNSDYMVTVNDDATWYCHSHEQGLISRPVVLE